MYKSEITDAGWPNKEALIQSLVNLTGRPASDFADLTEDELLNLLVIHTGGQASGSARAES